MPTYDTPTLEICYRPRDFSVQIEKPHLLVPEQCRSLRSGIDGIFSKVKFSPGCTANVRDYQGVDLT